MAEPLVTAIVPAFNAAATLAETLQSVAAQTWRAFECLIVDDGSTDETAAIAEAFCQADRRFTLLRKENGGVASARNHGLGRARGEFVAPLDADDLWHPHFLAEMVAEAMRSSERPGFVFCFSRWIDPQSRVVKTVVSHAVRGRVGRRFLYSNFVGNGSALLLSRAAALEAGGYDESLRRRGLEGAEDFLLQMKIARRHDVAAVPLYLVGYRLRPGSMSNDVERMIGSAEAAIEILEAESGRPEGADKALRLRAGAHALQLAWYKALTRRYGATLRLLARAYRLDPLRNPMVTALFASRLLTAPLRNRLAPPRPFAELDPADPADARRLWLRRAVHKLDARRLRRFV
jgi:glycosyltransferase involved in cell wall biosynthesis